MVRFKVICINIFLLLCSYANGFSEFKLELRSRQSYSDQDTTVLPQGEYVEPALMNNQNSHSQNGRIFLSRHGLVHSATGLNLDKKSYFEADVNAKRYKIKDLLEKLTKPDNSLSINNKTIKDESRKNELETKNYDSGYIIMKPLILNKMNSGLTNQFNDTSKDDLNKNILSKDQSNIIDNYITMMNKIKMDRDRSKIINYLKDNNFISSPERQNIQDNYNTKKNQEDFKYIYDDRLKQLSNIIDQINQSIKLPDNFISFLKSKLDNGQLNEFECVTKHNELDNNNLNIEDITKMRDLFQNLSDQRNSTLTQSNLNFYPDNNLQLYYQRHAQLSTECNTVINNVNINNELNLIKSDGYKRNLNFKNEENSKNYNWRENGLTDFNTEMRKRLKQNNLPGAPDYMKPEYRTRADIIR